MNPLLCFVVSANANRAVGLLLTILRPIDRESFAALSAEHRSLGNANAEQCEQLLARLEGAIRAAMPAGFTMSRETDPGTRKVWFTFEEVGAGDLDHAAAPTRVASSTAAAGSFPT